jgi:hypothetical protein
LPQLHSIAQCLKSKSGSKADNATQLLEWANKLLTEEYSQQDKSLQALAAAVSAS